MDILGNWYVTSAFTSPSALARAGAGRCAPGAGWLHCWDRGSRWNTSVSCLNTFGCMWAGPLDHAVLA